MKFTAAKIVVWCRCPQSGSRSDFHIEIARAVTLHGTGQVPYIESDMTAREGIPWQPMRLDDLLEEPFERLQEQQEAGMLERMDRMIALLAEIEDDLDTLLGERHVRQV